MGQPAIETHTARITTGRFFYQEIHKWRVANLEKKGNEIYDDANKRFTSADSQSFFAGGQKAFGRFKSIWGASLETEVLRSVEDEWSAQVAAAATGRKPLFHESISKMILTKKAYEDMKRRWPELKKSKDISDEAKRQLARLFEPGKNVDVPQQSTTGPK